jgi:hypothetical protein
MGMTHKQRSGFDPAQIVLLDKSFESLSVYTKVFQGTHDSFSFSEGDELQLKRDESQSKRDESQSNKDESQSKKHLQLDVLPMIISSEISNLFDYREEIESPNHKNYGCISEFGNLMEISKRDFERLAISLYQVLGKEFKYLKDFEFNSIEEKEDQNSIDMSLKDGQNIHLESLIQMEKNMYAQLEFVYFTEKRVAHHRKQIQKWQALQSIPLNGDSRNIAQRQHGVLMENREREILRVIEEGIERDLYETRIQQFFETWNQLPHEKRQNQDQFLNFYAQFYQPKETISEITTQKICSQCKSTLYNSKRESDWDCVNCGLFQTYLTTRTNVRIAYNSTSTKGPTSESKIWQKFIAILPQFVNDEESPVTRKLMNDLRAHLSNTQHTHPLLNWTIKASVINAALKSMDKKELSEWVPRLVLEFNSTEELLLMHKEEYEIIAVRLNLIRHIFNVYHLKHSLALCDPKYAFYQICLLYPWPHLLTLFPIEANAEEQIKWNNLIDFVSKHDTTMVWKLPSLPF